MAWPTVAPCAATPGPSDTRYDMAAAVEQDFQLACIPVFQFAIFYTMDLEINPGAPMKVTGKVHSNGNLYSAPPSTLEFAQSVDAAGRIYTNRAPYDPTGGSATTPVYDIPPVPDASSLTLPISTNNSPTVVQQITELPPLGEDPNSPMGAARYYNQCDLIVTTTATNVTVRAGHWDNFAPLSPGHRRHQRQQRILLRPNQRLLLRRARTEMDRRRRTSMWRALTNWMRGSGGGAPQPVGELWRRDINSTPSMWMTNAPTQAN